jgi:hypothetical protein
VIVQRIFISHSHGKSTDFGKFFYDWLYSSPIGMKPWASFNINDLPQGPNDTDRILDAARKSDLCICIMTKENLKHQWINFEAGIFYGKRSDIDIVYTILVDGLLHTDLTGGITKTHPLGRIYHCTLNNDPKNLENLLVTIFKNHSAEDGMLPSIPLEMDRSIKRYIQSEFTKELLDGAIKLGISLS